jgi:hypothetical protein
MQQTPDRHVRGLSGLPGSGYLLQVPRVLCNLVSNKKERESCAIWFLTKKNFDDETAEGN